MCQYPMISINLKDVEGVVYSTSYRVSAEIINEEVRNCGFLSYSSNFMIYEKELLIYFSTEEEIKMNRTSCVRGIATLIANYRKGELSIELDCAHVERWVSQFPDDVQDTILYETFYALNRNYKTMEAIEESVAKVLEDAAECYGIDELELLCVQERGESQKELIRILNDICKQKYNRTIPIWNNERKNKCQHFIYLDDGLYTGTHYCNDMEKIIPLLPKNSFVKACFLWSYDFGDICSINKLRAQFTDVTLEYFSCKRYHNNKNELNVPFDIVWPLQSQKYSEEVKQYYCKKQESGLKYDYSWKPDEVQINLFSCRNNASIAAKAFLEAGVEIQKRVSNKIFRPLGFSNTPYDFGFGSFVVSDMNISNTCPLALWWGDVENPEHLGWYPLFPRRDNKTLLQRVTAEEAKFAIENYTNVLNTVLDLAKDYSKKESEKSIGISKISDIANRFKKRIKEGIDSNLYFYLTQQNLDTIKIIQTVMYIGRDYQYQPSNETGIKEIDDYSLSPESLDPNALILDWMDDIAYSSGWKTKEIEIAQIIEKGPLPEYLTRGMKILGIIK